jgi:hypothetical protein
MFVSYVFLYVIFLLIISFPQLATVLNILCWSIKQSVHRLFLLNDDMELKYITALSSIVPNAMTDMLLAFSTCYCTRIIDCSLYRKM